MVVYPPIGPVKVGDSVTNTTVTSLGMEIDDVELVEMDAEKVCEVVLDDAGINGWLVLLETALTEDRVDV